MTWTDTPDPWGNSFFENLFGYEWELTKSPAGAKQWVAKDAEAIIPDAHDPSKRRQPTMLTTDLALRVDPAYEKISRRFLENPDEFALAFAKAWYKLLHRDMGPVSRYLGPWVAEPQLWQDPVPAVDHELVGDGDVAALKAQILDSGLSVSELVSTAWAVGRELPRHRQARWRQRCADPSRAAEELGGQRAGQLATVLGPSSGPAGVQRAQSGGKRVSLADLIVLGGSAAVEQAARDAGVEVDRAVRAGPHRRHPGADRRRVVRGARAAGRRVPQLPAGGREAAAGDAAARPGQPAHADRARDDRPRRRPAGPRREPSVAPSTASSPTGPAC